MARITVEDCLEKIPNRFQLVLASTSNAGHVELSKPNTISDFILLLELQATSPIGNFKARSHASASFLSNSAAKTFVRWTIF